MFNVLVQLSVTMEEPKLVWATVRWCSGSCVDTIHLLLTLVGISDLLHEHQDFVDSRNVFLNLCNIVLQDSRFDSFRTFQPLHDPSVLIADVPLYHSLNGLDLLKSVV